MLIFQKKYLLDLFSCFMPFFWSDPPFWWGPPLEVDRICTIPGHGLPSLQHQRGEQAGQSTVAVSQAFHQFRDHSLKDHQWNCADTFFKIQFLQIPFSAATFIQGDISCSKIFLQWHFCSDICAEILFAEPFFGYIFGKNIFSSNIFCSNVFCSNIFEPTFCSYMLSP